MTWLTLEVTAEKKPWTALSTRKTKRFLQMLLSITSRSAELDTIALLADTWDNDLDPGVSAQMVQAKVRTFVWKVER